MSRSLICGLIAAIATAVVVSILLPPANANTIVMLVAAAVAGVATWSAVDWKWLAGLAAVFVVLHIVGIGGPAGVWVLGGFVAFVTAFFVKAIADMSTRPASSH